MAVYRATANQGGESRPHAERAGSPRWSGLGGCTARREGMPGPPEAISRPQEGPGHCAPFETASLGRRVEMYLSPHLKIATPLAEITPRAMRQARDNLEPLWECAAQRSRAYGQWSGQRTVGYFALLPERHAENGSSGCLVRGGRGHLAALRPRTLQSGCFSYSMVQGMLKRRTRLILSKSRQKRTRPWLTQPQHALEVVLHRVVGHGSPDSHGCG